MNEGGKESLDGSEDSDPEEKNLKVNINKMKDRVALNLKKNMMQGKQAISENFAMNVSQQVKELNNIDLNDQYQLNELIKNPQHTEKIIIEASDKVFNMIM